MFTGAEKFFNWSRMGLLAGFKQRRGYLLLLIMFFVVLLFITLVFYSIFGEWGGGVLFLMAFVTLVAGGLIAAFGFSQLPGKRWVILASILLGIGGISLAPKACLEVMGRGIEHVRFHVHKEEYLSNAEMDRSNSPKFIRFSWGGFMLNPVDLVFDESDELSFPDRAKSESWWLRVGKQSEFGICNWSAYKVGEHFYVVRFSC
ncbi:hypothetical protein [Sulfuriferula sp.]|uniref:hypothetical protein n=1 Tax=Sulfuriferula sp. TaxID=2025307 RepID=UPI00273148B5|nr:hypothetical protein [Sulfuriferula sp.]MDP2025826.1 hypothetical protein [Sulfuriferula sp.]